MRTPLKRWTAKDIEMLRELYPKMTVGDCAEKLGRPYYSVQAKASRLGIPNWQYCRYDREHLYNTMTNLSSPETCYLLGFIWADGCVHKKRYTMRFTIVAKDMVDIDWLFKRLGSIIPHKFKRGRYQPVKGYSWSYKKLHTWLSDRGYQDKSRLAPTKLVQEISPELRHYFFRGWFDGDGHWGHGKQGLTSFVSRWSVASGYDQDWTDIEMLLKQLGLEYAIQRRKRKGGANSCVRMTGAESITRLGDYVYQGYETDGIGLKRKHKSYVVIKQNAMRRQTRRDKTSHEIEFVRANPQLNMKETGDALEVDKNRVMYIRRCVKQSADKNLKPLA